MASIVRRAESAAGRGETLRARPRGRARSPVSYHDRM